MTSTLRWNRRFFVCCWYKISEGLACGDAGADAFRERDGLEMVRILVLARVPCDGATSVGVDVERPGCGGISPDPVRRSYRRERTGRRACGSVRCRATAALACPPRNCPRPRRSHADERAELRKPEDGLAALPRAAATPTALFAPVLCSGLGGLVDLRGGLSSLVFELVCQGSIGSMLTIC